MRFFLYLICLSFFLSACGNPIKDDAAAVEVEAGTAVTDPAAPAAAPSITDEPADVAGAADRTADPVGFWVGDFRPSEQYDDKTITADDGLYWSRSNKINVSIDAVRGDSIFGHSVVAGNDRPFAGTVVRRADTTFYNVREPGDDRYDGAFAFRIQDGHLTGAWRAYKDIEIPERVFRLAPKTYTYDPAIQLEQMQRYVDWTNTQSRPYRDPNMPEDYEEDEEWFVTEYASSTNKIYTLNASNQRLTKAEVENLKRGDLTIIRNTIYARHGYSFKNRPLRVFFDQQPWYIPVHADIRADFTELEKDNIRLLLKYEENAAEYYDYFGRG